MMLKEYLETELDKAVQAGNTQKIFQWSRLLSEFNEINRRSEQLSKAQKMLRTTNIYMTNIKHELDEYLEG